MSTPNTPTDSSTHPVGRHRATENRTADYGKMYAQLRDLRDETPEITVSCDWGDGF